MNKAQYTLVLGALSLFLLLYFGFDTKTDKQQSVENARAISGESTSPDRLAEAAKQNLTAEQTAAVAEVEQQLQSAATDADKVVLLKRLSGLWYQLGSLPMAGVTAEEVATLENADTAWSVAGALFYEALTAEQDPQKRTYCADHAVKAFESAASLAPDHVEHRVNLALVYAENPPPDNPMKAVLMLRDLEGKNPDSPSVYNALGRLAIKTGQWERAIERLQKALSLDPGNPNTPCLLAKAYQGAGQTENYEQFSKRCQTR